MFGIISAKTFDKLFGSVINVSLCSSDDGINPYTCGRIRRSLQVVAAPFRFHNESAMRSTTLWCIQMIQIYLVDCLWANTIFGLKLNCFLSWITVHFSMTNSLFLYQRFTHREIGTASGFSLWFIGIIDERHFLTIENKPSLWPSVKSGTELMKISR